MIEKQQQIMQIGLQVCSDFDFICHIIISSYFHVIVSLQKLSMNMGRVMTKKH